MEPIELTLDADANAVRMRLPDDRRHLTPKDALDALADLGYAHFVIDSAAIQAAFDNPAPGEVVIAVARDAQIELQISEDALTATLQITPAMGGKHATLPQCLETLAAANVIYGIQQAAIEELIEESCDELTVNPVKAVVAQGIPPIHGEDSQFTYLVTTLKDRILKPVQRNDGSVDYHDLGEIPTVRVDTPLVRRIPPDDGTPGTNVHGAPIPAQPGNLIEFNKGTGTGISPVDSDVLIAILDGMPVSIERGMSVEKVYKAQSVGISSGNIHFDGTVIVDGDVQTGFTVFGSGDVTIAGVAESAEVTAGNDIFIKGGVSGNLAGLSSAEGARITSGNTLFANFIQFAEVHAKNGIICNNFVLNSNLVSQDWIKLGGDKPAKSKVMGGTIRARNLIKVDIAGSPNEVHTRLELFHDSTGIKDQKHHLEDLIRERENQLASVEKLANQVRENVFLPNHQELVKRGETVRKKLMDEIASALGKLRKLESQHADWRKGAKIVVCRKAYPGTEIIFGDRRLTLTQEWGPGTISYGEEGLIFDKGKV